MSIDLYGMPLAAGNRAVLLTAKALGIEVKEKIIDPSKQQQMTPEYLKINPQHTIPAIVDNGFNLWETRAILAYLVNTYGKDDSLYPKDPQKRAVVDQRLYFDMGTLYQRYTEYYVPVVGGLTSDFDPAKLAKVEEALQFLDTFLEGQEYVAGNQLTIADLSLVATVSSFGAVDLDLSPYKNVTRWLAKVKATAPGYEEANGKNSREYIKYFKSLLAARKS